MLVSVSEPDYFSRFELDIRRDAKAVQADVDRIGEIALLVVIRIGTENGVILRIRKGLPAVQSFISAYPGHQKVVILIRIDALSQKFPHNCLNLKKIEWFDKMKECMLPDGFHYIVVGPVAGHHDDACLRIVTLHCLHKVETAHIGKAAIKKAQIACHRREPPECIFSARCANNLGLVVV